MQIRNSNICSCFFDDYVNFHIKNLKQLPAHPDLPFFSPLHKSAKNLLLNGMDLEDFKYVDKTTLSSGQESGSWKMQVLLFLKFILMSLPVSAVPT